MITYIFYYLIFPGFLFLGITGILVSWIDRKLTARFQWRVGPPLFQAYYDIRKLFSKEVILPEKGNTWIFVISPVIAFLGVILASDVLIVTWLFPRESFVGDLIVLIYLFTVPSLAAMLGASASNNAFASLGASREMKSILGYELPFILSVIVAIIKGKTILLGGIILMQRHFGSFAGSISGFLALIIAIFALQAKLGMVPFDMAEAETELASGWLIEYSGPLLALWRLGKLMLSVVLPLFVVAIFWSGGNTASIPFKYLIIILVSILVKNTSPRLRIDQFLRFFWGFLTLLSILAVLLAVVGY